MKGHEGAWRDMSHDMTHEKYKQYSYSRNNMEQHGITTETMKQKKTQTVKHTNEKQTHETVLAKICNI